MVRIDFNEQCNTARGESVQHDLHSILICIEVPGCFKGRVGNGRGEGNTGESEN